MPLSPLNIAPSAVTKHGPEANNVTVDGEPECDFCRREIPCECGGATCMCTCGRCMAEPLPVYAGPVDRSWSRGRLA